MNHEQPLDLRSLARVESPEVVSAAVRRFRRRIFSTGAVVLLAAAALVVGILWAVVVNRTLEERIEESPGRNIGAVYERAEFTVVLTRVAQVDSGLGLAFVIASAEERGDAFLRLDGIREFDERGGGGTREIYLVVGPPDDARIDATLMLQQGCDPDPEGFCQTRPESIGTFTIDLQELGVPEELWKEGINHD